MSATPPGPGSDRSSQPPPPGAHEMAPTAMVGWATLGTGDRVELASPGRRFGARLIDTVIVAVVVFILFVFAFGVARRVTSGPVADGLASLLALVIAAVIALVITLLYEVTLIAVKGQTLGKMATGIKVVRADTGWVPGWGRSIGRWIIPSSLGLIPYAGWVLSLLVYVSLLWDKTRQGWHDKAAGTVVVRV